MSGPRNARLVPDSRWLFVITAHGRLPRWTPARGRSRTSASGSPGSARSRPGPDNLDYPRWPRRRPTPGRPRKGSAWQDHFAECYLPAATALSSSNDSRMWCAKSRWAGSLIQASKATLKTAIPASAVRLAAGSSTPRWRSAPQRRGQRGQLVAAFLQFGVGGDDGLA